MMSYRYFLTTAHDLYPPPRLIEQRKATRNIKHLRFGVQPIDDD